MTDEQLIEGLESGCLPRDAFRHADHVRAAFLYLRQFPALEALDRFSAALKRRAATNGHAALYHETITWAFVLLIRERIERGMRDGKRPPAWAEFAAGNADLLSWNDNILKTYYCDETLASDFARRTFTLPDRALQAAR